MKKVFFSSILVVGLVAILGQINAKHYGGLFSDDTKAEHKEPVVYSAKFKECIDMKDFPKKKTSKYEAAFEESGRDMEMVEASLKKFRASLDSTLKNLSYIDAHEFLHARFEQSKAFVSLHDDISKTQEYYHREIMRICYDNDRLLNLDSGNFH
ncbi:hypothetical protein F8C76_08760 [Flagellimonas olearia]|uniref:Uncharacterized protein n=1 Tax=Flagellimonas olearia TaxID=552546 RepID=A0A444VP76_9FLAO|nr:hypothetical protein [Allomuricauda olearia]KAB7531566.1 hypothetical protein F8C76_08760 [Allomuricauda olearia]RYC52519.1 hypothetical protein DN53_07270 [Allomuricauda olearia]